MTKKKSVNVDVKRLLLSPDTPKKAQKISAKNRMVKALIEKDIEISIAIFCLESVKYESEAKAIQFLQEHAQRHPPYATSLKD